MLYKNLGNIFRDFEKRAYLFAIFRNMDYVLLQHLFLVQVCVFILPWKILVILSWTKQILFYR